MTGQYDYIVNITSVTVKNDGLTLKFPDDWGNGGGVYDQTNLHLSQTPKVTVTGSSGSVTHSEDTNFNNENRYYTISADTNWELDIDRLIKEDDDGQYVYYIEEVGINDNTETPQQAGYTVSYTNNGGIEEGTIEVTNKPEVVDFNFTKTWENTVNQGEDKLVNNTHELRIVVQLERWYKDDNGNEVKDADVYDPITLYGDKSTYKSKYAPAGYSETSDPSHGSSWSGEFKDLLKKGTVNGKTVEYFYKIAEKQVYLSSRVDSAHNNLLKLGIFNSTETSENNSTAITNTFPTTKMDVEKEWKDKDGNTVTPDSNVTVTVQLQRRWRDISRNYDYSGTLYPGDWSDYADVDGKTLTLQGSGWTGTFEDLPLYGWRSEQSTDNKLSYVQYEYQVVETGVTINGKPANKYYTTTVTMDNAGQNDKAVTITNTETEKPAEFEFTKEWYGTGDTAPITWPKDAQGNDIPISVTITGKKEGASDITITKQLTSANPTASTDNYSVTASDNRYTFKFTNLERGYEYQVMEATIDGYHIEYYLKGISTKQGSGIEYTDDGGTIKNIVTGYELPESGGIGTTIFYILGSILLIGGAVYLVSRRRLQ